MSRRGGSGAQRSEESAFDRRYAALWNLNSFGGPGKSHSWAAIMLPEASGVGVRCCPVLLFPNFLSAREDFFPSQ